MLRPPYTQYSRIYTYHLDTSGLTAFDNPDLIGIWEEEGKTILIFHRPKDELIAELCLQKGCRVFYQADLDYRDWEMGREVSSFAVGPLTIAPIWSEEQADIRIDPSVVFGNGFHPSTRLCLESLTKYHPNLPGYFSALDLGCGTGLLAVCAARLGAASVVAVDHNPLACKVARKNSAYNDVEDIISVRQIDLRSEFPETKADLVMANLHHELLVHLFQNESFWQGGLYILSGFMPGEEELLLAALPDSPPLFLERLKKDKWCVWVLSKST